MPDTKLSDVETECLKLKKAINENHALAQKAAGDAVERGVLVGELLAKWKELLPHGNFETFVDTHFEGSKRTAERYMLAAKRLNALPKATRMSLLKSEMSITELLDFPKQESKSVAAGRDARKPAGTPATPKGGSNPPATADSGKEDRTDSQGTKPQDSPHRPPRSGKDKPVDFGICPNCNGKKWTEDEFGVTCAKCNHPHGEPVGDQDEERIGTQRSKTVKTVESLMRAIDDMHRLLPKPECHQKAIDMCKAILKTARNWK